MVDFKKLMNRTPEEIQAAQEARDAEFKKKAKQERDAIDALCAIDEGLSEWEVGFVDDIAKQYERNEYLTDAQWRKVNEILEEHGV